ncbi:MAG: hypothetical protein Q8R92_10790, partial [Deltaproteobacteria bacterium]|nr:hypothetical protein [Deltaproteobacteria bacterium]
MSSYSGPVQEDPRASASIFCGVLLTTLATLTLEITLTRVFSAVLWYHFAFLAVSVALCGAGAAGVLIYVAGPKLRAIRAITLLQGSAILFGLSVPASFVMFIGQKSLIAWIKAPLLGEVLGWVLTYVVFTVPFFFSGACVALALTRFKQDVSRVYFYDLTGAGLGCILVAPLLARFGGAGTVQVTAVLASLAAFSFSLSSSKSRRWALGALVALLAALVPAFSALDIPVLVAGKATEMRRVSDDRWNAYSRVSVHEAMPLVWGIGRNVGPLPVVESRNISIDAYAGTPMMRFDGDFTKMEFLKKDLSSSGYYFMPPGGSVLIIGAGGGRDIITALLFKASRVHAVEINALIVDFVQNDFGDFTDRIYTYPGVHAAVDEGRSYIARSKDRFDVIQASMVDTA